MSVFYSADGSLEEQRERRRRRDVACENCDHPWSEHKFGKECRLRKRTGLPFPNHRASCSCVEFKEPPKRRRQREKKTLVSF